MDIEYYVPEDFATDESFVNYCFQSDPGDVSFWEQWVADHPERRYIAEKARELVFYAGIKVTPEEKQIQWDKLYSSLKTPSETEPPVRRLRFISKTGILASILLIMVIAGTALFWRIGEKKAGQVSAPFSTIQYITRDGQKNMLTLSDGTRVWLNADSKLTSAADFSTGGTREVSLVGEAFFKVASNPSRPFIIHTKKLQIRVLGTEFNIEAYPEDNKEVAALISGSIQVSLNQYPEKKVILKPEEKLIIYNDETIRGAHAAMKGKTDSNTADYFDVAPLSKDPLLDSGSVETAWVQGKLIFQNESFIQLSRQMERWYNVDFQFSDSSVMQYHFTGIFSTETVSQALQALQMTSPSDPFNFKVDGNMVYISSGRDRQH